MFALHECPESMKGTEIEELFAKSELAHMSVHQRINYEESVMTENDILNSMKERLEEVEELALAVGRAEGIAKGREEGIAKGREEGVAKGREEGIAKGREEGVAIGREEGVAIGREEIVRLLHRKGMDASSIASMLDMDVSEVEKILK